VLLPVLVLARRADVAAVIAAALLAKAAGQGHRPIAAGLRRPAETVRGWLRRVGARLEAVRPVFTGWTRAVAVDPVLPGPAGGRWADALAAVWAAADALAGRFVLGQVPVWAVVAVVSNTIHQRLVDLGKVAPMHLVELPGEVRIAVGDVI